MVDLGCKVDLDGDSFTIKHRAENDLCTACIVVSVLQFLNYLMQLQFIIQTSIPVNETAQWQRVFISVANLSAPHRGLLHDFPISYVPRYNPLL